jgi:NAD(P)-dependent dehydrogenase (short-subunit alcohol dehydrogenase family)
MQISLSDPKKPRYQAIKDYILSRIETGAWPPNYQIPSEWEMVGRFNNAATTVKSDPFDLETLSVDDFQAVFAVNVIGAYQMCRAAIPHSGGGITNVSSNVAFTGGGIRLAGGIRKSSKSGGDAT